MAHFLAVDWDATDIRFVLAVPQRGAVRIVKAESSPLVFEENSDGAKQADVAQSLKEILKRHNVPRSRLLLGLNRASIDMMTFRLPKSKPEELPDLVKNQALRDSPGFSETSPLDFIISPVSEGENVRAIAATISREQLKRYRGMCQSAGYRAKRIEFRPLALAELYLASHAASDKPVLLVQCTTSEVDMVAVDEANVVFVRSIKLPDSLEDEERTSRIVSEITRTIAVSRQEIEGTTLENVIIYGNADDYQALRERLADQGIEVVVQNPFQLNCVSAPAKSRITGATVHPGHYAALFGMILSEQSKTPIRIDFLHPREKPQPLNIARFVVLFLLLVGVIGYATYAWNHRRLAKLENHLAEINADIEQMQAEFQRLNPGKYLQLSQASMWENQPLIWLDELRDISMRLPDEQDLVIDQIRFSTRQPYCVIDLLARVRDTSVLQLIINRFKDGYHIVTVHDQQRNQSGGGYPISCSIRIQTNRRPGQSYLQFLSHELRQLSRIMPELPKIEPERPNRNENVTDTATNVVPRSAQEESDPTPREKPQLRHVFAKEYEPKPTPPVTDDATTQQTTTQKTMSPEQEETVAPPRSELPHVQPPEYSPSSQRTQKHVYPDGYRSKDEIEKPSETESNPTEGGVA